MSATASSLSELDIRAMAIHALDKIQTADKPKALVWDPKLGRIRSVSLAKNYSEKQLQQPTFLGIYDFETSLQDIIDDFCVVYKGCQA